MLGHIWISKLHYQTKNVTVKSYNRLGLPDDSLVALKVSLTFPSFTSSKYFPSLPSVAYWFPKISAFVSKHSNKTMVKSNNQTHCFVFQNAYFKNKTI